MGAGKERGQGNGNGRAGMRHGGRLVCVLCVVCCLSSSVVECLLLIGVFAVVVLSFLGQITAIEVNQSSIAKVQAMDNNRASITSRISSLCIQTIGAATGLGPRNRKLRKHTKLMHPITATFSFDCECDDRSWTKLTTRAMRTRQLHEAADAQARLAMLLP